MLLCFLVKVLTRLYPTIDSTNLQADMVCLRVDIDTILDIRVSEPKAAPADLVEDRVLAALFTTTTAPPPPPRYRAKRHRSRDSEEKQSRKKYRTEMEYTRRDSLFYEEARQMRARELGVGRLDQVCDC